MPAFIDSDVAALLQLDPRVPPREHVQQWWPRWRDGAAREATPIAMALRGGFDADRAGWAFAAGYQAALRRLHAALPADIVVAFCVSEDGGNRPRDIATRITPLADGSWRIDGAKRWTTLGAHSGCLLVVGAIAAAPGVARPALKVAAVASDAAGVTIHRQDDLRFVPEVPHARVTLSDVRIAADALLDGDGYDDYVKPFRSVEDNFVALAMLAYLLREARVRDWPTAFVERLCAVLESLCALAQADAKAATTHVSLAGALAWARQLYEEAASLWALTPDDAAASRWQRDAPLLQVAAKARELRTQRAWQRLHR